MTQTQQTADGQKHALAYETPSAFDHLIDPELKGLDGVALLIEEMDEKPRLRRSVVMSVARVLRDQLAEMPYEAPLDTPVTIEAQHAVALLDLLLRRTA